MFGTADMRHRCKCSCLVKWCSGRKCVCKNVRKGYVSKALERRGNSGSQDTLVPSYRSRNERSSPGESRHGEILKKQFPLDHTHQDAAPDTCRRPLRCVTHPLAKLMEPRSADHTSHAPVWGFTCDTPPSKALPNWARSNATWNSG